jgi:hypothetical protein
MASSSGDKEKVPLEDNHQDLQPKEEVESEIECGDPGLPIQNTRYAYNS